MPEYRLAHEYHLSDFEGLVLRQDAAVEAAEVMLNLLDNRYITSILHKTALATVTSWVEAGRLAEEYGELLMDLPEMARENLAVAHAVLATGETPPDPEDIPDSQPGSLLADWEELEEEAQEKVLLNAVHISYQLRIGAGAHPYAIVYAAIKKLPGEAQSAMISKVMTQYVRQYHSSRQNRN